MSFSSLSRVIASLLENPTLPLFHAGIEPRLVWDAFPDHRGLVVTFPGLWSWRGDLMNEFECPTKSNFLAIAPPVSVRYISLA
ncbi:hypothetical protein V6N13_101649 [Hibiscus sabdariffa]